MKLMLNRYYPDLWLYILKLMLSYLQLVQMLLRHGANALQMNSKGKTPLDSALNEEIRSLLKNEIIASTSSSSSQSPTSPESALLSDKEDDHKHESQGWYYSLR